MLTQERMIEALTEEYSVDDHAFTDDQISYAYVVREAIHDLGIPKCIDVNTMLRLRLNNEIALRFQQVGYVLDPILTMANIFYFVMNNIKTEQPEVFIDYFAEKLIKEN